MTIIAQARALGWNIYAGTLQAKGLYRGIRNEARTDDDVTVWCTSRDDAARECLRFHEEVEQRTQVHY